VYDHVELNVDKTLCNISRTTELVEQTVCTLVSPRISGLGIETKSLLLRIRLLINLYSPPVTFYNSRSVPARIVVRVFGHWTFRKTVYHTYLSLFSFFLADKRYTIIPTVRGVRVGRSVVLSLLTNVSTLLLLLLLFNGAVSTHVRRFYCYCNDHHKRRCKNNNNNRIQSSRRLVDIYTRHDSGESDL